MLEWLTCLLMAFELVVVVYMVGVYMLVCASCARVRAHVCVYVCVCAHAHACASASC